MEDRKREFYQSLIGREFTISSLVGLHNVTRITATKWLKQLNVPVVEGTWPPKYTLPEDFVILDSDNKVLKDKPTEMLQGYLKHLLDPETEVDIAKLFRNSKNAEDVKRIIKGLEDTLAVAHFYSQFFTEDGLS